VAALESTAILATGQGFSVARLPGTDTFATVTAEGGEDTPAAILSLDVVPPVLDYRQIALAFSVWNRDIQQYLFYFRRLVDHRLPLDVRWLNGYRLLEWHFLRGQGNLKLPKFTQWSTFVKRFDHLLQPCLRGRQTPVGLLEEARALSAHAGLDDRSEAERLRDPRNAMEKTFRAVERMVMTILNEHPARLGHPVRFEPKAEPSDVRIITDSKPI
jgi:hypothetical protein